MMTSDASDRKRRSEAEAKAIIACESMPYRHATRRAIGGRSMEAVLRWPVKNLKFVCAAPRERQ